MLGIIFFTYLFLVNTAAFCLYGIDKRKAVYGLWRIPEILLLLLAILGGAYGAALGMLLFRHKTMHRAFTTTVPICLVVWLALLVCLCLWA